MKNYFKISLMPLQHIIAKQYSIHILSQTKLKKKRYLIFINY